MQQTKTGEYSTLTASLKMFYETEELDPPEENQPESDWNKILNVDEICSQIEENKFSLIVIMWPSLHS